MSLLLLSTFLLVACRSLVRFLLLTGEFELVEVGVLLKMLNMELRLDFFDDASDILRRMDFRWIFRCGNDPK